MPGISKVVLVSIVNNGKRNVLMMPGQDPHTRFEFQYNSDETNVSTCTIYIHQFNFLPKAFHNIALQNY